jgi:hypothetical protein
MNSSTTRNNLATLLAVCAGIALLLSGCGNASSSQFKNISANTGVSEPIDTTQEDGVVVHGRAIVTVSTEQETTLAKAMGLIFPKAYAANGSVIVNYTNSASTTFTLNNSAFTPGAFTGTTLSLGNIAISALSDNNLKVCGTGSNTKCTGAVIRVYTTGSIAGFVNTADAYGVPVYAGTMSPTTPVGLLAGGSVQVQGLNSISSSKHTVTLADFPSPSYAVTSDFSNAGAGSYSMTYVVEYVLTP